MNPDVFKNCQNKGIQFANIHSGGQSEKYFVSGMGAQDVSKAYLDIGTELLEGRFVIKEKVGEGKFCNVYQAYDNKLQSIVALKIGTFSPIGNNFIEQLLVNEHKVNSFVRDKRHVLEIYEVNCCMYEGAKLVILSMEYADGSLRDWLTNNGYDPGVRRSQGYAIFRQACLGLASLHDNNIYHLDLKPENLLFVRGVVKIADFGLSSFRYSSMHSMGNAIPDLRYQMGTAQYMSPEQFIAPHIMSIDHRSDIYSLSVILYEMSHPECKTPFEGNEEFQRYQHVQRPVPGIDGINNTVKRIIDKGLQKNPDDRYQNIPELIEDFDGRDQPQQEVDTPEYTDAEEEAEATQDNRQIIEQLWDETLARIHEPDFEAAKLLCLRIIEIEPNHGKAVAALRELETRFEKAHQFYESIKSSMDTESLEHLVELLVEAVHIYPKHPDGHLVQMQLSSRSRLFAETMERRVEVFRRDRLQRQRRANMNPSPRPVPNRTNTTRNSSALRRPTYPFRPARRPWYQKLWDYTKEIFSG